MTALWSNDAALARLRPRLWNFVRAHGRSYHVGVFVEKIFDLPPGSFEELLATHLSLSEEAGLTLSAVEYLIPRLPSTVARREEEYAGLVHGPVDWARTTARRVATSDPTLFVCRPTERRYDTPPARVCAAGVAAVARVTAASGLGADGDLGELVTTRSEHARRLRRHPKIASARTRAPLRHAAIARVCRRWPTLQTVVDFTELVGRALDDHAPEIVDAVVTKQLLAPARGDDLFELEVAFDIVDALEARGFVDITSPHLISDAARSSPLMRMMSPEYGTVALWWERSFWRVHSGQPPFGVLHDVLDAAGMSQSPFRPDLLVEFETNGRIVVVEVKATSRDGVAAERRAILEAFAYLLDADQVFMGMPQPHAFIVAWNATGCPSQSRVLVSDQHHVGIAVDLVLASI